jgi:hypothetical protein
LGRWIRYTIPDLEQGGTALEPAYAVAADHGVGLRDDLSRGQPNGSTIPDCHEALPLQLS